MTAPPDTSLFEGQEGCQRSIESTTFGEYPAPSSRFHYRGDDLLDADDEVAWNQRRCGSHWLGTFVIQPPLHERLRLGGSTEGQPEASKRRAFMPILSAAVL